MYKLIKDAMTQKVNVVTKQEGDILISIPFDPQNVDYQAYLAWVEAGGVPLPADEVTQ